MKNSHHRSVVQRESNSYIIVDDLPSSGENNQTFDSVDSTRLSVKKKKGHKRRASKERNVIIADIMDGTDTEPDLPEGKFTLVFLSVLGKVALSKQSRIPPLFQ